MYPKDGTLESPAYLGFVRRQQCMACELYGRTEEPPGPTEAHHFPPKGQGGARHRDDRTIPLCRCHHEMAQTYIIGKGTQEDWVYRTRDRFLERATIEEIQVYVAELLRFRRRPLAVSF